jgi:hypothetical protein
MESYLSNYLSRNMRGLPVFLVLITIHPLVWSQEDPDVYGRAVKLINEQKGGEAATKTLIREYTYDAGASDSKITARKKALKEVKRRALSEIGVHVRSYLNLKTEKSPDGVERFLDQSIRNITAGTVQTKILKERWTGKEYYVKARLTVDAESVAEGISAALRAEASKEKVSQLKEIVNNKEDILSQKSDQIKALEKKAANRALRLEAREERLKELQDKVERLQAKIKEKEAAKKRVQSDLEKIRERIRRATDQAWEMVERRMTPEEVVSLVGMPRSPNFASGFEHNFARKGTPWNYGATWVYWKNEIVRCVSKRSPGMINPCKGSKVANPFNKYEKDEFSSGDDKWRNQDYLSVPLP